jgi:hypothetical protein
VTRTSLAASLGFPPVRSLSRYARAEIASVGVLREQVHVVGLAVELGQLDGQFGAQGSHGLFADRR